METDSYTRAPTAQAAAGPASPFACASKDVCAGSDRTHRRWGRRVCTHLCLLAGLGATSALFQARQYVLQCARRCFWGNSAASAARPLEEALHWLADAHVHASVHARVAGLDVVAEVRRRPRQRGGRPASAAGPAPAQRPPLRQVGASRADSQSAELRAVRALLPPDAAGQLAAGGEPLDDAALRRWLRARRGAAPAAAALAAHAAWRAAFAPAGRVLEARRPPCTFAGASALALCAWRPFSARTASRHSLLCSLGTPGAVPGCRTLSCTRPVLPPGGLLAPAQQCTLLRLPRGAPNAPPRPLACSLCAWRHKSLITSLDAAELLQRPAARRC
jgi:hypothetical protein